MDTVYDAALKHADKLQTELKAVKAFIELHEHFRDRLGFGAPASAAEPKVETAEEAPVEAAAEPEIKVAEPEAEPAEVVLESAAKDEPIESASSDLTKEALPEAEPADEPEVQAAAPIVDAQFEPASEPEAAAVEPAHKAEAEPAQVEEESAAAHTFQEAVSGVLAKEPSLQVATAGFHTVVEPAVAAPATVTGYTV